ncbi:zinc-dependent alcohol dehydrogenase family protein [Methylosinus sporium]|uniref:zinc-dependent alcohol dehydrogenase family protein n=1 Tax=Methylosinus sporium TaxID=428 RepID=UPI00383B9B11
MSRIIRFHRLGGPEVLQIDEMELRAPKAGEIRLRVRAIGLNRAESMFRSGAYIEAARLPSLLGYEASGEIEAMGEGVTGFSIGDAVSTMPAFSMTEYGVYGDAAIVPAHAVVKHPKSLSWSEAAAIWMQYLTAYGALVEIGGVLADDRVIVTAASSSVGLAAIQIARAAGATPIAVTRKNAKREALLKAGAGHVVVAERDDLVEKTRSITEGKGARLVFDPIGGPGVEALAEAAAIGGTIFLYGALSSEPTPFPLFAAIRKQLTLRGYTLFSVTLDPQKRERGVRFILDGLATGSLRPIIARSFPLEQIVEAHRFLESNEQIGKVVVTV